MIKLNKDIIQDAKCLRNISFLNYSIFKIFMIFFILFLSINNIFAKEVSLLKSGEIPSWLIVGPFELSTSGWGVPVDDDKIGEETIKPFEGKNEKSDLVKNNNIEWQYQSINEKGVIDFNETIGWEFPSNEPIKNWECKTAYAYAQITSPKKQEIYLLTGSNSQLKIILNNETICNIQENRNLKVDNDTTLLKLNKGINDILIKVGNSYKNYQPVFFVPLLYEWGFSARLVNKDFISIPNLKVNLIRKRKNFQFDIISTFFFKKIEGKLKQQFDVNINSPFTKNTNADMKIKIGLKKYEFKFTNLQPGMNRKEIFLSALNKNKKANCVLKVKNKKYEKNIILNDRKKYELYMVMLSHTDIGYTNPQPIVIERHLYTLDSVIEKCEKDPEFYWTIETIWQFEQYKKYRSKKQFQKLLKFVKNGRIDISPIYVNPFTGRVSTEEMIRSLDLAKKYGRKYGINYSACIYNDVPGEAWFLPQLLSNIGVNFLANGINEVYSDFPLQRNLPKAFYWEGADGSKIINYINKAYIEGMFYGFERDVNAIKHRMWNIMNKLEMKKYTSNLVLMLAAYSDNSIIPENQYKMAKEWNKKYEYPKIVISNLSKFAKDFSEQKPDLSTLKGDWTSSWDILGQGEPKRMKKAKWIQHQLLSAEKMSTIASLLNDKQKPLNDEIDDAYDQLLLFNSHGSGLEYGYASDKEDKFTMDIRGQYVDRSIIQTKSVLERSLYQLTKKDESFDAEGVYVFNPLSWKRDMPIELHFPVLKTLDFDLIDISTNETIPTFSKAHNLFFIAKDLPSLGYKKFKYVSKNEKKSEIKSDLKIVKNTSIENKFYKVSFNKNGKIKSIIDKKSNNELIDKNSKFDFCEPVIRKNTNINNGINKFEKINIKDTKLEIIDERPIRLILSINRENSVFSAMKFILWNDLDRIDIKQTVNLEELPVAKKMEEYNIAFPFAVKNKQWAMDILGGYLDPEKDKLPGIKFNSFSVRRIIGIHNEQKSIYLSAINSRVMTLDNENEILFANLVNNFPKAWHRQENNKGKLNLKFSITSAKGKFDSGYGSRFGWSVATEQTTRKTWFTTNNPFKSYLNIDNNNIVLLTMKLLRRNKILLRLKNINQNESEETVIRSEFFKNAKVYEVNFLDEIKDNIEYKNNEISISIKPEKIKSIIIENENKKGK